MICNEISHAKSHLSDWVSSQKHLRKMLRNSHTTLDVQNILPRWFTGKSKLRYHYSGLSF